MKTILVIVFLIGCAGCSVAPEEKSVVPVMSVVNTEGMVHATHVEIRDGHPWLVGDPVFEPSPSLASAP
jgi:hypothetical protein